MFLLCLAIALVSVLSCKGQPNCQLGSNTYTFHQSCYKFVHEHFSWPEAITYCATLGGELVRIESAAEHNFLIHIANQLKANDTSFDVKEYWINLSDAIVQGEWMWMGNTRLNAPEDSPNNERATYVKWGPNQPDDHPNEDCAGLWFEGGFLYGDWPCSALLHAICEDSSIADD
ncbi:perlucin-like [Saccostrea echinata]|uniref:perlucin-like n=1 Tax=Saccostrea echinata TaxID=191078 RepID=UPI002A8220A9|nr:perlucin-like [Saccostrea echinata]